MRRLFAPVDIAAVAQLRIAFGAMMLWQSSNFIRKGWIEQWYTVPRAHTTILNLIHARDLADLLVLAAEKGERVQPDERAAEPTGLGLYYAADKERLTLGEVVGNVAQAITQNRIRIFSLPIGFAWIMAGASEAWARIRGQSPGIVNLDKVRSFAAGSFTCSPDKSAHQLGFSPSHSLSERLSQTLAWYQEQGWL